MDIGGHFTLQIMETPGIQAPLAIITKQEVVTFRDNITFHCLVSGANRCAERVIAVAIIEVGLRKNCFLSVLQEVDLPVTNRDFISGETDNPFHIVLPHVVRWPEYDDVAALWFAQDVPDFIDDDVFVVFEGGKHGISLHFEWGNDKCPDNGHDGNDDDDVQENVKDVVPKAVPVHWELGDRLCILECHSVPLV